MSEANRALGPIRSIPSESLDSLRLGPLGGGFGDEIQKNFFGRFSHRLRHDSEVVDGHLADMDSRHLRIRLAHSMRAEKPHITDESCIVERCAAKILRARDSSLRLTRTSQHRASRSW